MARFGDGVIDVIVIAVIGLQARGFNLDAEVLGEGDREGAVLAAAGFTYERRNEGKTVFVAEEFSLCQIQAWLALTVDEE